MGEEDTDIGTAVARWLGFAHPPYHTAGILPFFLGTLLAWRLDKTFNLTVFLLAMLGIFLVLLSSYHARSYFDSEEDERSRRLFRSPLAGGSGVIPDHRLPRSVALWVSIVAVVSAGIIGIVLQFGLHTGRLTLLLACIGILPALFYSTRWIRIVDKGFGELSISICYGWLPLASAFYIQRGYIAPCVHSMALPITLSIFNVVLLNEFLDPRAEADIGTRNLLALLGKKKAGILYILVSILSWVALFFSIADGIPRKALYIYLPVMALSAGVSLMMARGKYENPLLLELLCGLTLAVNLGTAAAYLLAFL
jgi:1,4-dihydroxy-2-naphthoate polyprenyltransferase